MFLTQDPIGMSGGVYLYAYAGNNPLAFTDPIGLAPCCLLSSSQGNRYAAAFKDFVKRAVDRLTLGVGKAIDFANRDHNGTASTAVANNALNGAAAVETSTTMSVPFSSVTASRDGVELAFEPASAGASLTQNLTINNGNVGSGMKVSAGATVSVPPLVFGVATNGTFDPKTGKYVQTGTTYSVGLGVGGKINLEASPSVPIAPIQ
ncbi:MAG TPA: RHS repeat-associated core domain-containing protein [Gemmatimonadales bacterium]|nr:RHS repeat-associated core domain-containing protein [Gemmatimonadales bacterium]